jgi:DNA-binding LacI/PurR family transcriptional regulator
MTDAPSDAPGASSSATIDDSAPSRAPTIRDVAAAAGVSVSTVSHVVNRTRPVADETRRRVEAAVARFRFRPSGVARALKGDRTGAVGMLAASSSNPFFAEVIEGVEERCFERDVSLILCNTGDDEGRLARQLEALLSKRIDGLFLLSNHAGGGLPRALAAEPGVPVVAIDAGPIPGVAVVADDSEAGGSLAGAFLAMRGFRDVGVVAPGPDHPRAAERVRGFEAALEAAGWPVPAARRATGALTMAGGRGATEALLAAGPPPEAIFCANDLMAVGALAALAARGLRTPGDVSVMGYDDVEIAAYAAPPLTTVRQPAREIGRRAADRLLDGLAAGAVAPGVERVAPRLIERASVGRPRGG